MRRFTRLLPALPFALFATGGLSASPAYAAEPIDNDELVAGPEFAGIPDKSSHSGVFLDLIAVGSSSVTNANTLGILAPAAATSLRVAIFDGNAGGHWDQNLIENVGGLPVPDGSVVEYDLVTASPDFAETVVAQGDSESATPRAGATVFTNAVDGRWEFLYDGPQHPKAKIGTGQYAYRLTVKYRLPTPAGPGIASINGYKVAANAVVGLAPLLVGQTVVGGFIGGVVDSRNLRFGFEGTLPDGKEFSVSRDHYPDVLEPDPALNALLLTGPTYAPAVRYPAPDAFVNGYTGTFEVKLLLAPGTGQTWASFLSTLILEEGDADDVDDLTGIAPDGSVSPINPGIPPDDGGAYSVGGVDHNNSGYRLPVAAEPQPTGSPKLEVFDPNGVLKVTLLDLSGNVSTEDATGSNFEKIPLPADGIPGVWTLRMSNLDARNSWFLRTNASFLPETPTTNPPLKGNNGVGNGIDPPPPGNPPLNDGEGTSPGNPGNKGGSGGKN